MWLFFVALLSLSSGSLCRRAVPIPSSRHSAQRDTVFPQFLATFSGVDPSVAGPALPPGWTENPLVNASQVVDDGRGGVFVLGPGSLFHLSPSLQWTNAGALLPGGGAGLLPANATIALQTGSVLVLVVASSAGGLVWCEAWGAVPASLSCNFTVTAGAQGMGRVSSAVVAQFSPPKVYIGSSSGLFVWDERENPGAIVQTALPLPLPVTALAVSYGKWEIAIGTGLALFRLSTSPDTPADLVWQYDWVAGVIDNNITALAYDPSSNDLYIGNSDALNVLYASNETYWRYDHSDGLPWGNITSLSVGLTGAVWIGTTYGVTRYGPSGLPNAVQPERHYLNGPRWFPGFPGPESSRTRVLSLASGVDAAGNEYVTAVTTTGVGRVTLQPMTLAQKAAMHQALMNPQHNRHGLVEDVTLARYGDRTSYQGGPSDNSGLWTSVYLASQALRYSLTGSADARAEALGAFSGIELLNNITGLRGYPARSAVSPSEPPQRDYPWHPSPVPGYSGWWFKGTTSSDEITGHILSFVLFRNLVAESPGEIARVERLMADLMTHIIQGNFTLIGVEGRPTEWGRWDNHFVNENPGRYDQRGLNALQILVWLLAADQMVGTPKGDPSYINAYHFLCSKFGYDRNVLNQKIAVPNDDNFSDDELAMLPYLTYAFSGATLLRKEILLSLRRHMRTRVQPRNERASLWIAITLLLDPESTTASKDDALFTLRTWPVSHIDWPSSNLQRGDVRVLKDLDRSGGLQMTSILNYDEFNQFRWNGNPFDMFNGGSGFNECDPGAALLSYWTARYAKIVE
jgi:hypothetical protein